MTSQRRRDDDKTLLRVADMLRKAQEQRRLLDSNLREISRTRNEVFAFREPPDNERYFLISFLYFFFKVTYFHRVALLRSHVEYSH